jgi:hypothetical protein
VVVQNVKCYGGNDGSITLGGTGGTTPYTYSLNNGAFTNSGSFTTNAGTHSIVIKDANSCTITVSNIIVGHCTKQQCYLQRRAGRNDRISR